MIKFVFLLTVWTSGDLPQVYVEDYDLTGEDCIARMMDYVETDPHQTRGAASCEIDAGQPWDELPTAGVFLDF